MMSGTSVKGRLKTYTQRESYIWLCIRGDPRVAFGWILRIDEEKILFKDDEFRYAQVIKITDIEHVGAV